MKKGDIVLSINRVGEFSISPEQFYVSQCGTNEKVDYKYEVTISATDKRLIEPEMFVVDNLSVREYFEDKYVKNKTMVRSCEVIACEAIEDIRSWFLGDNAPYPFIDLKKIRVIIRGSDLSFITGEWESSCLTK